MGQKSLKLRCQRVGEKRRLSWRKTTLGAKQQRRHLKRLPPRTDCIRLKGFAQIGENGGLRRFRLHRRISANLIVGKSFHPWIPFFSGEMRLGSPEIAIGLARRISLTQLVNAQRERRCHALSGRVRSRRIGYEPTVDQNQAGNEARLLRRQRRRHKSAHRMPYYNARAESHSA